MNPCDEASNDDHEREPTRSAEAHESSAHKHQHGRSDQRPFPVCTHDDLALLILLT